MVDRYFTFGFSHTFRGESMADKYMCVSAPEGTDHRALLMAYIGGNEFASEYSVAEFTEYKRRYNPTYVTTIAVFAHK